MPFLTLKETYKPAWKKDDREMLTNLVRTQDLIIKAIFFEKPPKHKATYRRIGIQLGPPWAPDRYEEIDHCMVIMSWKTQSPILKPNQIPTSAQTTSQ